MRTPIHGSEFSRNLDRLAPEGTTPTEPEIGSLPDSPSFDQSDIEELKTGTTTVGLTAEDGVVLATDKRASLGNMVSSKTAKKVEQVHPAGAITIAGSVSAAQSLIRTLKAESNLYGSRRGEDMSMQALSTLMSNLLRSGAFFVVVPVLGGVDEDGAHIYSFDALGGAMEEEYTVSGSGAQFAYGVLEQEYDDGLSMAETRSTAVDAIHSATERDTASGNGIWVAEITEDDVEITEYDELDDAR